MFHQDQKEVINWNNNCAQQHLRKHGAVSGFRKVRSSWLPLVAGGQESAPKSPTFLSCQPLWAIAKRQQKQNKHLWTLQTK